MKKLIFIFLVSLLASCDNVDVSVGPGPLVTSKDNVSKTENKATEEINPIFNIAPNMGGSNFGDFFQTLYIQNEYETMLAFTSKGSVDLYGKEVILEHYKNMKFGYKLGNLKKTKEENGLHTLIFISEINATDVKTHMCVVIENDSCKVVLGSVLDDFPLKY
jgi:hypothetical protein